MIIVIFLLSFLHILTIIRYCDYYYYYITTTIILVYFSSW